MHAKSQGNAIDQFVEIIKVLGTPAREEMHYMNPIYTGFRSSQVKSSSMA